MEIMHLLSDVDLYFTIDLAQLISYDTAIFSI